MTSACARPTPAMHPYQRHLTTIFPGKPDALLQDYSSSTSSTRGAICLLVIPPAGAAAVDGAAVVSGAGLLGAGDLVALAPVARAAFLAFFSVFFCFYVWQPTR